MTKLAIFMENVRGRPPIYQVTQDKLDAALAKHPGLAAKLDITVGWNDEESPARKSASVLFGSRFDPKTLRQRMPAVRWIQTTGAGVEHLAPLDWLGDAVLTNASGVHGPKAGEFGLLALLMLNDHMPAHVTNQRKHEWSRLFSTPIAGKTALIIGTGGMGASVAEKARAIGVRLVGVSRSGKPHAAFDRVAPVKDLMKELAGADFVVVACPLTHETRGLIGAKALDAMKPGAGIVNIGRAAIVDYEALAARLASGHVSGAVLDVFDPEPLPPEAKWWDVPNLIVIPHVSSDHADMYLIRVIDGFFANVARHLSGQPLENRVDPKLGY